MQKVGPQSKPVVRRAKRQSMPVWLLLGLAFVLGVLVYGLWVPSPPSAFDRPEAQNPDRPHNPWTAIKPL